MKLFPHVPSGSGGPLWKTQRTVRDNLSLFGRDALSFWCKCKGTKSWSVLGSSKTRHTSEFVANAALKDAEARNQYVKGQMNG